MATTTVECACCFNTISFSYSTYCSSDNPHFFCFHCARQHALTRLEMSQTTFKCININTCSSIFDQDQYTRFLEKEDLRYLEQVEISNVKLLLKEEIDECPICNTTAIYTNKDDVSWFICSNSICCHIICRKCSKTVAKCSCSTTDIVTNGTTSTIDPTQYENIVACPNCKITIYKDGGCNLIQCRCGTCICYLCLKDITNIRYLHYQGTACNIVTLAPTTSS